MRGRQTDRERHREGDRERETHRVIERQTETQGGDTERYRERKTERDTERVRQRGKHREIERENDRHRVIERDTQRHTAREQERERDRQTEGDRERDRHRETQAYIQTERGIHSEIERQTDREAQREGDRERDRDMETDRERQTDRQRQRESERERVYIYDTCAPMKRDGMVYTGDIRQERFQTTNSTRDRHRTGRPRVTTQRQDRHIHRSHLQERFLSASETARNVVGNYVRANVGAGRGNGVTAQRYIDQVLRAQVVPFFARHGNFQFQQDNARPHTARITQAFLQQHNINTMP
ncbi:RNA-binding protein 25-like [Haliotis cracherodii]|uniref:RNA-binding protein 25-like n=1 Tax=Haliotis cracherodii TaxID=6455 RepID=UPI0039ED6ACF